MRSRSPSTSANTPDCSLDRAVTVTGPDS
jgi:hypothetical protein